MVSQETLEVVLRMKDELTQKVREVDQKINQLGNTSKNAMDKSRTATSQASNEFNQQSSKIEQLRNKYNNLKSTVTNAFNGIKNAIKNSTAGQMVSQSALAKPFLNAAESIKQKWSSMVETLKSRLKGVSNQKVEVGFNISNTGLKTLNGEIATATTKTTAFGNAINKIGQYAPSLGSKLGSAFTTITTKIQGAYGKISSLTSSMSMLQGTIMSAFGAVGVTSLSQFTIGAAIARDKLNAVTTSITGSAEATKTLNKSISEATRGGVVGFTNVAKAVQQIGMKYNLSNEQLAKTPPLLNKIGTYALAMGKDGTTAAQWMARAYDGLNGNFMVLKRQLGITKEQLIDAGWSGAANDVDGYTRALEKVLETKPEMQAYLNSYEGQMMQVQMAVKSVGRQIGEIFLPVLKWLLQTFLDINKACPWLTTVLIGGAVAFVAITAAAMVLLPILQILAMEIGEVTVAQKLLNIVSLSNPWLWVAIAIIAVVAALAYLYTNFESCRKIMDSVGQAIWNTLIKAWNELQKVIAPLYPTLEHLGQVFSRLAEKLGFSSDKGGALESILWILGEALKFVVTIVVDGVKIIVAIFIPALNLLINIISAVINFVITLAEAFSLLAQGDFNGFIQTLLGALGSLGASLLEYFGQFVIELLNSLGTVLFGADAQFGTWLLTFITNGVNGAISFVMGFVGQIMLLPSMVMAWLNDLYLKFLAWSGIIILYFKTTAQNMVTGFITWISTLPAKLWTWLNNTYLKVLAWSGIIILAIKTVAQNMVDGFKNKIMSLPQTMWDELVRIKDKINAGIGMLVDAIKGLGQRMLDGFKSVLGINSPGFMFYAVDGEMNYIQGTLENAQSTLSDGAKNLGASILEGFNSNDFSTMKIDTNQLLTGGTSNTTTPILNSGDKGLGASADMDVSINPQVSMNTTAIAENITAMAELVNPQLATVTNSINTLGFTSSTNTTMILANNEQVKLSYQQLQLSLSLALQNINTQNTNAWTNIKQTTINNLNSILTSTKNVTTQMIQAWQTMKNSIVQAANDIKSQSEQRFNSLWNTIKTFYNRIQHPGGAGSPAMSTRRRGTGGHSAFKSFANSVQNRLGGVNGSVNRQTLRNKGFQPAEIEYLIPRSNGRVKTSSIFNYIENLTRAGAGGWSSAVKPNVDWIRNTTNKWKTAPPTIVRYKTSHGFEVGDFEHGEPRISFNEFRQIAEDVFSQCHYLFYMDSSHYGHWIPAARAGWMNCDDSTEFLLAMARSFGFSGTKVHGYWNNIGHYWANIAGHKMDTTGWMNRRTWTPSASHSGPVPRGLKLSEENDNQIVIIELLQMIYNLLVGSDENNTMKVIHEGKVDYKFKHEIEGTLPDGLTAEDVVSIMNAHVEDSKFIRLLTGNREFMDKFERMYNKIRGEHERFS